MLFTDHSAHVVVHFMLHHGGVILVPGAEIIRGHDGLVSVIQASDDVCLALLIGHAEGVCSLDPLPLVRKFVNEAGGIVCTGLPGYPDVACMMTFVVDNIAMAVVANVLLVTRSFVAQLRDLRTDHAVIRLNLVLAYPTCFNGDVALPTDVLREACLGTRVLVLAVC